MHTRVEVVAVGLDECAGRDLAQSVEAEVKRLERCFNRFDNRSPLAVMNARAAAEDVAVDDDMFMALELCEAFRRGTAGYFDIATNTTVGGQVSYSLNADNHTVRYTSSGISLDMGGFAKGFALERVRRMVVEAGAESALINFGNSSVAAISHQPYGEWWGVGVEHTRVQGVMAHDVHLCDNAMSVSGRTPRGEYHIVNPRTGGTVAGEELILVEGRSALVAEVLSTALYAAPRSEREEIMRAYDGYRATELYCREGGATESREL
jgi:thiamine biosynthesis lipoprotein